MKHKMKYCYKTRYPEIFKNVYWGNFTAIDPLLPEQEIIKNRNDFIEQHQIIRTKDMPSKYDSYTLNVDHSETYEDRIGRIIHVYSQHPNSGYAKYPMYRIIKPIYATEQVTRMCKYETRKSRAILMKEIFRKIPDEIVKIINGFLENGRGRKV